MSEYYFPCGHKIVLGHTCPVCVNDALVTALEEIRQVAAKQIKEAGWQNRRWLSERAAAALASVRETIKR